MQTEVEHAGMSSMDVDVECPVEDDVGELRAEEKKQKAKLARERRELMMAKMNAMQKAFMQNNSNFFPDDNDV